MNKRKVRKLRETVTPKPYFASFNYPLEDPKKPMSPVMDLSDNEDDTHEHMMDTTDSKFMEDANKVQ